jgi:hypothetical protein
MRNVNDNLPVWQGDSKYHVYLWLFFPFSVKKVIKYKRNRERANKTPPQEEGRFRAIFKAKCKNGYKYYSLKK